MDWEMYATDADNVESEQPRTKYERLGKQAARRWNEDEDEDDEDVDFDDDELSVAMRSASD